MARKLSKLLLIALAVILIAGLSSGGFLFATNTGPFAIDTTTKSYNFAGAVGEGGYEFGTAKEVLARVNYVTSWDPTLNGQQVAWSVVVSLTDGKCLERYAACTQVSLKQVDVAVQLVSPDGARVTLKYNTYDMGGAVFCGRGILFQTPCPATWSRADVVDLRHPDGKTIIPDGWTVDVTAIGYMEWYSQFGPDNCQPCGQGSGILATDRAVTLTGVGTAHWEGGHADNGGGIYVVTGETIKACWSVGYSREEITGTGWSMDIFSQAQNKIVLGPTKIAKTQSELKGCLSYTVVDADFKRNSTDSILIVSLTNELWAKDFQAVSAVRAADVPRMPTCYDEGFSPQSPKQGDVITYKFRCVPVDSTPENAVNSIKVQWGYGSPDNVVILPGTATSYSFTATQAGIVNLALTGFTADGVPSGTHNFRISVEHQPTNTCFGSVAFCNPNITPPLGIPFWVYFVIAGIILMLVAFLIPRGSVPPLWRVILALIGVVLILLGVVFFG